MLTRNQFLNSKGEVFLSQSEIRQMTELYDIEEIVQVLGGIVDELPYPFTEYTDQEIISDFNALKNSHLEIIKEEWVSHRVSKQIDLSYRGERLRFPKAKNIGGKVSNQFTEKIRLQTPHARYKSWVELWSSPRKYWLKYFFNPKMYRGDLRQDNLKLGLTGQYNCSQFKPLIAKSLYDVFDAKSVLDFSAGWGDRLVGFHASNAESYVGIDPNTKLHDLYPQISNSCNTNKSVKMICSPAEDVDYTELEYDFIFTSPPYFDLERYSQEDTQSWKRYKQVEHWLDGFLLLTLTKCWTSLKEGGRLIVNISDVYTKGQLKEICKPMIAHMESLGATYEGVIGYEINHRATGSVERSDLPFCEPMFVWTKGVAPVARWNPYMFFGV